jgi:hypothetical protein
MGNVIKALSTEKFREFRPLFLQPLYKIRQDIYNARRRAIIALVHSSVAPELKLQSYGERVQVITGERSYLTDLVPMRRSTWSFSEAKDFWVDNLLQLGGRIQNLSLIHEF